MVCKDKSPEQSQRYRGHSGGKNHQIQVVGFHPSLRCDKVADQRQGQRIHRSKDGADVVVPDWDGKSASGQQGDQDPVEEAHFDHCGDDHAIKAYVPSKRDTGEKVECTSHQGGLHDHLMTVQGQEHARGRHLHER